MSRNIVARGRPLPLTVSDATPSKNKPHEREVANAEMCLLPVCSWVTHHPEVGGSRDRILPFGVVFTLPSRPILRKAGFTGPYLRARAPHQWGYAARFLRSDPRSCDPTFWMADDQPSAVGKRYAVTRG